MSAARLREAARVLRERAEPASYSTPWTVSYISEDAVPSQHVVDRWYVMGCFDGNPRNPCGPFSMSEWEPSARYIATMHPGVALALADWLDACGDFMADHPAYRHDGEDYAARVADLILASAS